MGQRTYWHCTVKFFFVLHTLTSQRILSPLKVPVLSVHAGGSSLFTATKPSFWYWRPLCNPLHLLSDARKTTWRFQHSRLFPARTRIKKYLRGGQTQFKGAYYKAMEVVKTFNLKQNFTAFLSQITIFAGASLLCSACEKRKKKKEPTKEMNLRGAILPSSYPQFNLNQNGFKAKPPVPRK